jgi:hypothetical protein
LKSKQGALRILLDTYFILPTLGIDTGKEVVGAEASGSSPKSNPMKGKV